MIGFIGGMVVGAIIGVAVMCCCFVAGEADRNTYDRGE